MTVEEDLMELLVGEHDSAFTLEEIWHIMEPCGFPREEVRDALLRLAIAGKINIRTTYQLIPDPANLPAGQRP